MTDAFRALLSPDSVAIVGLSADADKHGARVLRNLRLLGYGGKVWGVNRNATSVDGVTVVPSVAALPETPDVVVCAVPAAGLPEVLERAGERGTTAAVVFSGGFAEAGESGRRAQDELVRIARASGLRILGPNSGGVIHPSGRLALSFLTCLDRPPDTIRTGPVGLVTQSGGTGSYLVNLAAAQGGGLAASISTGNEADLGLAGAVAALAEQDSARAIAVVLEAVRDGPAFLAAVRRAHAVGKPVVALLLGTSDHGQRLMRSHTGALAAPSRVLEGICDSQGITVTRTPAELLDVATLMARAPVPRGRRIGVVTHSGGTAILLSDLAADEGVCLPAPPPDLARRVTPLLEHGSPTNPLDLGAIIGGPHRFADAVRQFTTSDAYDAVLAVTSPHPPAHTATRVDDLVALHGGGTPLLQLWLAGDLGEEGLSRLRDHAVPVTEEPRAAMRALAGLVRLAELRAAAESAVPEVTENAWPVASDTSPRTEHGVKNLLRQWGFPVVDGAVATTSAEARAVARSVGFPVALKVSSPDVQHKSDVGGVRTDLHDEDDVEAAFDDVCRAVAQNAPGTRVDGALVEQYRPGLEIIV
ncbi:MAG: acetate--CoA ligase family protein, partial [Streptosporangiales bacterium]|nr:acetate--CoA ligase family protein [Streptosporangiales bacterium]